MSEQKSLSKLSQKCSVLQSALDKRKQLRQQRKRKQNEQISDLCDQLQQKTQNIISKLQDLKRKQSILFTIQRIEPQIAQNWPKNYFLQLVYQDISLSGNQKYVDFDQCLIQQKFILPLLSSSKVKLQIFTSQEEPILFDRLIIDLQHVIQQCLMNGDKADLEVQVNKCKDSKICYKAHLQGVGFGAWLKNINLLRATQTDKEIIKHDERRRKNQIQKKLQHKKRLFSQKFIDKKVQETKAYQNDGIDQILNILSLD